MGLIKVAFIVLLIATIVGCGVYYMNSIVIPSPQVSLERAEFADPSDTPKKAGSDAGSSDGGGGVRIALFHAEWCGHCVTYIKSNVFMNTYNTRIATDAQFENVSYVMYDADTNKELVKKYNIHGFPTIVALDSSGRLIDTFAGDRNNSDELLRFTQKALQE